MNRKADANRFSKENRETEFLFGWGEKKKGFSCKKPNLISKAAFGRWQLPSFQHKIALNKKPQQPTLQIKVKSGPGKKPLSIVF